MTNDRVSPDQGPVTLPQLAPPTVQLLTQRLIPPPLLPWKKRKLDPLPTGSMREQNPSPPIPTCHCTGPVGVPTNVTEPEASSCEPPLTCREAALANLPPMSP